MSEYSIRPEVGRGSLSAADMLLFTSVPQPEADPEASCGAYARFLESVRYDVPEVGDNEEFARRSGNELIERFSIMPDFFSEPSRALVFAAIANRWSNTTNFSKEQQFLANALTLLAGRFSYTLAAAYNATQADSAAINFDADYLSAVIDRYTDRTMTRRLEKAIAGGLLQDIRKRMGITHTTEAPYELRVVTLGDEVTSSGMASPVATGGAYVDSDDGSVVWTEQEAEELTKEIDAWRKELEARVGRFAGEMGWHGVGTAWTLTTPDTSLVCIPFAIAEKLVEPASTRHAGEYGKQALADARSLLEHEYAHLHGGLKPEGTLVGRFLEEIRVIMFALDKTGHLDAQIFANQLKVVTGTHPFAYMRGRVYGGTPYEVFGCIANEVGLDRMLELVLVRPQAYEQVDRGTTDRAVSEYLGGYDGILGRIIADKRSLGETAHIQAGVDREARSLLRYDPDRVRQHFETLRELGLRRVTSMVERRYAELLALAHENGSSPVSRVLPRKRA